MMIDRNGANILPTRGSPSTWTAWITGPDNEPMIIGQEFESREQATAAYHEAHRRLYPAPPPSIVDPARHHTMSGAALNHRAALVDQASKPSRSKRKS